MKKGKNKTILILLIGLILIFGSGLISLASEYPNKTITIISPGEVGGSDDILLRTIAPFLAKQLDVPVVVQSMPGAGGRRGMNYAWSADPNGYTLVGSYFPSRLIGQLLYPESSDYDMRQFEHVASWTGGAYRTIVARVDDPEFKTIEDVIKVSKEGRRLTMGGGGGLGSTGHLQTKLLEDVVGLNIEYIPFDGGSNAVAALLGGHIDLANRPLDKAIRLKKAGELKILAVHAPERLPELPDVPTLKELGFEGMVLENGAGIWAPPGTPKEIVDKLEEAVLKAYRDPEYIAQANKLKTRLLFLNSEEFLQKTLYDYENLSPIIETIKVQ